MQHGSFEINELHVPSSIVGSGARHKMQHDDPFIRDLMRQAFRRYVGLPDVPDRPHANHDDYAPYVSREEMEEDVWLAVGLLDIYKEERDDRGAILTISPARVEPDSPDEREARAAAARLLRAGAWGSCGEACQSALRRFLADFANLLAPGGDSQFELVLRRRGGRRGPVSSESLKSFISHSLAFQIKKDGCVEAAISDMARRCNMSERTVWNIWEEDGRHILNIWSQVPE
jgi:hypothetical protein